MIPCITHQTKIKERRGLIDRGFSGELKVLVTSRVLNEELIYLLLRWNSHVCTGTVREHVQRLGRLRPSEGKRAVLYELVAQDTAEEFTSKRRRRHDAYK